MKYDETILRNLDDNKVQKNIENFIRENGHSHKDVEDAYLNITTDTNENLVQIIQGALNQGLPMNKIGEIIAKMKTKESILNEEQNNNKVLKEEYLTEVHSLQFDQSSREVLGEVLKEGIQGDYIFKVGNNPFAKANIKSNMDMGYKVQILRQVFKDLKQFQGSYKLKVDFLED
jgi:DNA-binding transcriptional MerR regulator